MEDKIKYVTEKEFQRVGKELERARDLAEMDISRMTLAEKVEHKRRIKQAMERARG